MNILMVGSEGKGSWKMRGIQLGGAIGARVTTAPEPWDWEWADLVVLVKRAAIRWQAEARAVKVPVVWDVLDFWAQPEENDLGRDALIAKVRSIQEAAGVSVLIGATRAMADDIGGIYLPHHCRIGLAPAQIREKAQVVAYEGQRKYLGRWAAGLEQACAALELRFVVNPPDIRAADVLVSFRDGQWDGWACQRWKSGVKHVNALVAGRPIVSQQSSAWSELKTFGAVINADTTDRLAEALRMAASREIRSEAYECSHKLAQTYQLPNVAREYSEILRLSAKRRAA